MRAGKARLRVEGTLLQSQSPKLLVSLLRVMTTVADTQNKFRTTMTTAQSNAISYTVCDDATTVANAVEVLQPCRYIAFDCEGRKLGREGGCLSIISLCAIPSTGTQKAHIFLIDVMALDTETVRPIFDLLSSQEHVKIMFDGRMDWSELYHRSDVQLTQVLDLQLADIDSRSKRGERLHEQLCRISSFFYGGLNQDSYNMVHRLNGLEFCAKEHNIVNRFGSVKPSEFTSCFHELY